MKIEIRNFNETDDYILHVSTVKINPSEGGQTIFLNSDFLSHPCLTYMYHQMNLDVDEKTFIEFMIKSETIQLITWASCIAEYSYKYAFGCPFWSKENDLIWEKLVEFGIVELKDKE